MTDNSNGEQAKTKESMVTDLRKMKVRVLIAVDFTMEKALESEITNHIKTALELLNEKADAKIQTFQGRVDSEFVKAIVKKPKKGGDASPKEEPAKKQETAGKEHAVDSGVGTKADAMNEAAGALASGA